MGEPPIAGNGSSFRIVQRIFVIWSTEMFATGTIESGL